MRTAVFFTVPQQSNLTHSQGMNSDESQKSAATEAGAWFGPGRFALMLAALILASFLEGGNNI